MSIFDKVVAAVTPLDNQEARQGARLNARVAARPGDWLSMVLDHHGQLEAAFTALKATGEAGARIAAQKSLAILLTGHANAEESVLYPALAQAKKGPRHDGVHRTGNRQDGDGRTREPRSHESELS